MTKDEALKLALEALNHYEKAGLATIKTIDAIAAIKKVLAQPEHEPVAWLHTDFYGKLKLSEIWPPQNNAFPVYTHPPKREPLTNGEIYTAYITATNQTLRPQDERLAFAFARAIEAAHGIKGDA